MRGRIWLVTYYLESKLKEGWPFQQEYIRFNTYSEEKMLEIERATANYIFQVQETAKVVEVTVEDITKKEVRG